MTADYRRSVGALQGISGNAFTTDAALVRVGGFVARPLELGLSIGTQKDKRVPPRSGRTVRIRPRLSCERTSQRWSALVGYDRYQYALRGIDPILRQVPDDVNRNAVRVGLAMNLPIAERRSRPEPTTRE